MNSFLISVGAALVLSLVAAFIGPVFVDWNGYRDRIETAATRILCREVNIAGDLDVRLLPQPVITTGRIDIADASGVALATVEATNLHLDLGALLLGGIEVTALDLDRPRVAFANDAEGRFNWGPAGAGGCRADLAGVTFQNASVSNGTVSFVDAVSSASMVLDRLDLTVAAGGLAGPYRITGTHGTADVSRAFTLAAGRLDTGGPARVSGRFALDEASEASFDGTLKGWNVEPHYSGTVRIVRVLEGERPEAGEKAELRLEAKAGIGPRGSDFTEVRLSATDGRDSASIAGEARVLNEDAGPRVSLDLTARRLDLGVLVGGDGRLARSLADLGEEANAWLGESAVRGRLALAVDGVVHRGELVQDVEAILNVGTETIGVETFRAVLPGQSEFGFSGGMASSAGGGKLVGNLVLSTRDIRRLFAWLLPPSQSRLVRLLPDNHGRLSVTGGLTAEAGGLEMTGIDGLLEGRSFSGDLSYGVGGAREADADLTFDDLDLDRLVPGDFTPAGLLAGLPDGDAAAADPLPALSLRLAARRVNWRGREARGAEFAARFGDGEMQLERFRLDSLAGASVLVRGNGKPARGGAEGRLEFEVDTADLPALSEALGLDLARFLDRGPAWTALVREATLAGRVQSARSDQGWRVGGTVSGRIGGTDVDVEIQSDAPPHEAGKGRLAGNLKMTAADASLLLAQIGVPRPRAAPDAEPGGLRVDFEGSAGDGFSYRARAEAYSAEIAAEGAVTAAPARVSADVTANVENSARLAAALGLGGGEASSTGSQIAASLELKEGALDIARVRGTVAGAAVAGSARVGFAGDGAVSGDFEVETLSLLWAAQAMFAGPAGEPALTMPVQGAAWSADLLDNAVLSVRPTEARLRVGRLVVADGLDVTDADIALSAGGGEMAVSRFRGGLGAGSVEASGSLRQTTLSLQAAAEIAADAVPLSMLMTDAGGRPLVEGEAALDVRVSATGRSALSLVSSLSGEGRIEPGTFALPRLVASELARRSAGAGNEAEALDAIVSSLDGKTAIRAEAGTLSVANGRITLEPLRISADDLDGTVSAFVNLAARRLDQEIVLRAQPGPRIAVVHAGEFGALSRDIEVDGPASGPVRWTETLSFAPAAPATPPPDRGARPLPPADFIEERLLDLPIAGGGAG